MRAQPGGVGQRRRLAHAAAPGEGFHVAARCARLPDPAALGDEIVDAERGQSFGLAVGPHARERRGGVELLEHDIGRDVLLARYVERITAARV